MQESNEKKANNEKKSFILTNKFKALIIILVGVIVFFIVVLSPAFAVQNINIQGSEYYAAEEIRQYLSYLQGKNGFFLFNEWQKWFFLFFGY